MGVKVHKQPLCPARPAWTALAAGALATGAFASCALAAGAFGGALAAGALAAGGLAAGSPTLATATGTLASFAAWTGALVRTAGAAFLAGTLDRAGIAKDVERPAKCLSPNTLRDP